MADNEKTQIFEGNSFDPKKNKPEPPVNNNQDNQYSPEPPTRKQNKSGNGIVYGVAGAAAGAGILFASQTLAAEDAPVEAEVVDADTIAGMDSVKIGGQDGVVNAILVDANHDGIMDGQINLDGMGGAMTPGANVNHEAPGNFGSANEMGDGILMGDQSGHVNAILMDANGDGIIDSKIDLLPIGEVIEDDVNIDPVITVTPDVVPTNDIPEIEINDQPDIPIVEAEPPVYVPEPAGILDVADNITDDMSFAEAFAAARADVGAGGIFYWHGQSYGTYYENEWANMSDEQQDAYWDSVSVTVNGHETSQTSYDPYDASDLDYSNDDSSITAMNDADVNDTDDFGGDFDNNADMGQWS